MELSMTGQEKRPPFNTGNCLIEMNAYTDFTVLK